MPESTTVLGMGEHVKRSSDYREVYANVFRAAYSNWDVQLTFARGKSAPDGAVEIADLTTVFITPAQAKSISEILTRTIAEFEKQFGSIAPVESEIRAIPSKKK